MLSPQPPGAAAGPLAEFEVLVRWRLTMTKDQEVRGGLVPQKGGGKGWGMQKWKHR